MANRVPLQEGTLLFALLAIYFAGIEDVCGAEDLFLINFQAPALRAV